MNEMRGRGAITDSPDWTFWQKTVLLSNPRAREISHVARFAWTALYLNVGVVLWGAYVRATGSGAGCGYRWPLCDGNLVGASANRQTIVEFTHRTTSVISLLVVTGLVVWCWRVTKKGDWARYSAVLVAVLLANEAILGAALVLLKHVGNDQSAGRILFLCLHFGNTLLLLATLSLTADWLSSDSKQFTLIGKWREVSSVGLGLLATMVTGITGGGHCSGRYSVPVNLARLLTGTRFPFRHTRPPARSATPSRGIHGRRILRFVGYLEQINRTKPTLPICTRSYHPSLRAGRNRHDECIPSRSRLGPDRSSIRSRCALDIACAGVSRPRA